MISNKTLFIQKPPIFFYIYTEKEVSSVKPGYRLMAESTTTAAEQTHSGDVNSVYPLVTLYHLQNQLTFLMWSLCHDFVEGSIFALLFDWLTC